MHVVFYRLLSAPYNLTLFTCQHFQYNYKFLLVSWSMCRDQCDIRSKSHRIFGVALL